MRRAIALLVFATACASASGGPNTEVKRQSTTVTYTGPTGAAVNINLESSTRLETRSSPVAATPRELWAALPLAYQDMRIPLAAHDSVRMYMGNPGLMVNRRLGDERLSRFLNCGVDPLGSTFADRYQVRLSVVSRVLPADGGSVLETQVSGEARQSGASGDPVSCVSTGALEEAIANAAKLRLAGSYPRR